MSEHPKVLVIVGPTASGKSALALDLARRFGGELICADSRTIYKGMDIGTAKPTTKERAEVPHYLLDVVNPDQRFTVTDFKERTAHLVKDITNRGKLPIIVGGTGLYIDSYIFDYTFGKPADEELRQELEQKSVDELVQLCREKDIDLPENSKNKRYLIRAIELGGLLHEERVMRPNTLVVGLQVDRETLRARVTDRARVMFASGVIDETKGLVAKYGWGSEAMTGGIYRVLRRLLSGELTEQQAFDEVVQSDMRLAKKQMTWFKRNPHIQWVTPDTLNTIVTDFLA